MFLWFKFSREQRRAMRKQINMTQEIFDSIIQKCEDIGSAADDIFYSMLEKYPEQMLINAEKIACEYGIDLEEEIIDAGFDPDTDKMFTDLMKKIEIEESKPKRRRYNYVR